MGMTEILSALMLLGGIADSTGKKSSIIAFSDVFEQAFGFSFNGIYDRQRELYKRKPYNITNRLMLWKLFFLKNIRNGKQHRKTKMKKDDFAIDW